MCNYLTFKMGIYCKQIYLNVWHNVFSHLTTIDQKNISPISFGLRSEHVRSRKNSEICLFSLNVESKCSQKYSTNWSAHIIMERGMDKATFCKNLFRSLSKTHRKWNKLSQVIVRKIACRLSLYFERI